MSRQALRAERTDVELLDAGEGRRLERFGPRVLDRPAPVALGWRRDPGAWREIDLRFDLDQGWSTGDIGGESAPSLTPWHVQIAGLTLELRATSSGGVGLYPEHVANLPWIERQVGDRLRVRREPPANVLNLFAHTGLATLVAARAGAAVAHVDGARTAIAWARRNAELSGFVDRPIRWLVDDATSFVAREARRGRRYDGIVLDPPSFGHAGKRRWRLEDELPALLARCAAILADDGFVLLTAHTEGLDGASLEAMARAAFPDPAAPIATAPLELVGASGARLDRGWSVRVGAS